MLAERVNVVMGIPKLYPGYNSVYQSIPSLMQHTYGEVCLALSHMDDRCTISVSLFLMVL
jgi:hypothetical protein